MWFDRWFLWLALFGFVELFNQMLTILLDGFEASQVSYFVDGLVSSSLDFTLALVVPPLVVAMRKNEKTKLGPHLKKFFNQACIESLRSTARVCWWSYLFFIPGFIKVLRLQFVPYIVQYDATYDAGKRDALNASEKLSRGHLLQILLIFILCSLLTMLEGLRTNFPWNSPFFALAFVLTLPLRLYTQIVWLSTYEYLRLRRGSAAGLKE